MWTTRSCYFWEIEYWLRWSGYFSYSLWKNLQISSLLGICINEIVIRVLSCEKTRAIHFWILSSYCRFNTFCLVSCIDVHHIMYESSQNRCNLAFFKYRHPANCRNTCWSWSWKKGLTLCCTCKHPCLQLHCRFRRCKSNKYYQLGVNIQDEFDAEYAVRFGLWSTNRLWSILKDFGLDFVAGKVYLGWNSCTSTSLLPLWSLHRTFLCAFFLSRDFQHLPGASNDLSSASLTRFSASLGSLLLSSPAAIRSSYILHFRYRREKSLIQSVLSPEMQSVLLTTS